MSALRHTEKVTKNTPSHNTDEDCTFVFKCNKIYQKITWKYLT